jgi:uncharacterized integral membrane protein
MLHRIVRYIVLAPAVVVLAAIGLANTQDVRLALDPFRPGDPALSLVLPFYVWLLTSLIVGVLIGGMATWASQAHWRQSARRSGLEAQRWKAEVARLTRERQLETAGR